MICGVLSDCAAIRLLGNEVLAAQMLCFDHALAYVELFFPGTIENYQASLPHWRRDTSHLWSVAGRLSGAPLKPPPESLKRVRRCKARSKRTGFRCGAPAMVNGCCYHHGGATPKHGRRRVRLKPLNPTAADYLFDKIESDRVACIDKRDAFGAVEQTMAKLAVLERLSRK